MVFVGIRGFSKTRKWIEQYLEKKLIKGFGYGCRGIIWILYRKSKKSNQPVFIELKFKNGFYRL